MLKVIDTETGREYELFSSEIKDGKLIFKRLGSSRSSIIPVLKIGQTISTTEQARKWAEDNPGVLVWGKEGIYCAIDFDYSEDLHFYKVQTAIKEWTPITEIEV